MCEAEYIYLLWDGEPTYEVIRGHIGDTDAVDMIEREGIIAPGYEWVSIDHNWGRWIPDSIGEYDMKFHLAGSPQRGAFPVTLLWYE